MTFWWHCLSPYLNELAQWLHKLHARIRRFRGGQMGATAPPHDENSARCPLFLREMRPSSWSWDIFFSLLNCFGQDIQIKKLFSLKTKESSQPRVQNFSCACSAFTFRCAVCALSLGCPSLNYELDAPLRAHWLGECLTIRERGLTMDFIQNF